MTTAPLPKLAVVLDILVRAKSVIAESEHADEHQELVEEMEGLVDKLVDLGSEVGGLFTDVMVAVHKRGVQ